MTSSLQQPQENEETLSQIFCLNAIQMMYSMYFTQDNIQMQNYPNFEESSVKETKFAFQSRVVDLKLRRYSERSHEIQEKFIESLQESNDNNANQKEEENNKNNIDDAFVEPPAPRPAKYKYLALATQKEKSIPKNTVKGLDFKKIAKEQRIRLSNAREKGINRAKRRAEKMRNIPHTEESNDKNVEKYYQRSENSEPNV